MNKSEALKQIVIQARAGELVFPANVQATLRIQEALNAPDCGIESAARLVVKNPLMATRIVAIANSVAYSRFGGGVTNTRTAITILGFSTLRSVIAAVVMKQLRLSVRSPQIRERMEALWQHSAQVGAIAHLLARRLTRIDAETALFAGVVHEIGGFYLLSRAEEFPALLSDETVAHDDDLEESEEIVIGRAVLHKLLVPKRVVSAIETVWYGSHTEVPETLGDTLLLANTFCNALSPFETRSATQLDAQRNAAANVHNRDVRRLLQEEETDIRSLAACLTG